MTTQEIASRLAALCAQGEFENAQKELYAENAVSIEPDGMPGADKETKGLSALNEKIRMFMGGIEELFGITVSTPIVAGNAIAFTLVMDLKMKGRDREKMSEICVYEVKDEKIVSEQFFI